MYVRTVCTVMGLLVAVWVVSADSIRVGDRFYRDVYIRTTKEYYRVYFPEEGRMERISRRRSNVSEPTISGDEAYRASLWARYEAAKAGEADGAATPVQALDGRVAKHRRAMRDLAEFEAQLAHWRTLSSERRGEIEAGLETGLEVRQAERAESHARAVDDVAALGETRSTVASRLEAAARERQRSVAQAQQEDDSGYYLQRYEDSKRLVGPYYHYYYDAEDRLRSYPVWYYEEIPGYYDAAVEEYVRTQDRIDAAGRTYAARADRYGQALNRVERALTQRERDARAAVSKALDDQRYFGSRRARVASLSAALEDGYRPQLASHPVASWSGTGEERTPAFSMARGVWRIQCEVDGPAADDFSVTVYDAETEKPFTRIAGADFLGMRMRVFDEPGRYYLVIEPGLGAAAFRVTVESLAMP